MIEAHQLAAERQLHDMGFMTYRMPNLVGILGMHKDLFILFKPGIHGSKLNVDQVGEFAFGVLSHSSLGFLAPHHYIIPLILRGLRYLYQIFGKYVRRVEAVGWVVGLQPSDHHEMIQASFYHYHYTHTSFACLVSTMYSPPNKIRMRLGVDSIYGFVKGGAMMVNVIRIRITVCHVTQ